MSAPTPNQAYREDLRAHGGCRDCEAPLLASERNHSRCGVCRAKRNVSKARRRGDPPASVEAARERVREAREARIAVLGYDDGAGDREAVRGGRSSRGRGPSPAKTVEVRVRMPADLHRRIVADAADRGESVEAWVEAEARAALEADVATEKPA